MEFNVRNTCNDCGKYFYTKRAMSVHRARADPPRDSKSEAEVHHEPVAEDAS